MPRNSAESLSEQVKKHAKNPVEVKTNKTDRSLLVPSGVTMLDLACSNTIYGAFKLGTMVNIIGDKSSGKTMLALSMLAECSRLDRFNDFDFIFDDVEAANAFDMSGMFGKKLASRMQQPSKHGKSETVKEMESNIIKAIQSKKPFIYVLDSFDALTTDEEIDRAYARAAGTKEKGSMGMQKAKGAHELFRVLCRDLQAANGLLVIISQVKENMDPMSFKKFQRTGGKALDFYAFHHIWLAHVGSIKKGPADRQRTIGHNVRAKVDKNKLNGNERDVDYDTYNTYGIDDIGSMVDFMIAERYWKPEKDEKDDDNIQDRKKKKRIDKQKIIHASDFNIAGTRNQLILHIDENKLDRKLKGIASNAWAEIEESLKLDRKPKYS